MPGNPSVTGDVLLSPIKLRFGQAQHGWLPTALDIAGQTLHFDVSYLPYDFIGELIAALSGILYAPGEYAARICEEPTEHDWRFRASDTSAVAFDIVTYRTGRRTKQDADVVVEVSGPPLDIVLPFWRGLRELAGRAKVDSFRAHWSEPFPFDALDRLTECVKQVQAASA